MQKRSIHADDTRVSIASENLNELIAGLENELKNILDWMRINKLSLNASKSKYMAMGHIRRLNRVGDNLPDPVLSNQCEGRRREMTTDSQNIYITNE